MTTRRSFFRAIAAALAGVPVVGKLIAKQQFRIPPPMPTRGGNYHTVPCPLAQFARDERRIVVNFPMCVLANVTDRNVKLSDRADCLASRLVPPPGYRIFEWEGRRIFCGLDSGGSPNATLNAVLYAGESIEFERPAVRVTYLGDGKWKEEKPLGSHLT